MGGFMVMGNVRESAVEDPPRATGAAVRAVTALLKGFWISTVGPGAPVAVGVPPEQEIRTKLAPAENSVGWIGRPSAVMVVWRSVAV